MTKEKNEKRKHSFQRPLGCHHVLTIIAYSTTIILSVLVNMIKTEKNGLSVKLQNSLNPFRNFYL